MKKILIFLLALLPMAAVQAKPNKQTVVLYCDLHCQGCCDKIMKNIAFEKGVKDIQFDMEQQAVTVTFDANKTDVPTLQKAFAQIGKPATTRQPESAEHSEHADHDHHEDAHQGSHEGHQH
ncbi:MAG: heavy-metal-associated domain-containing protein [Paludibacteraceae bacterium]